MNGRIRRGYLGIAGQLMPLPLRVVHYNKLSTGNGIKIENLQRRKGIKEVIHVIAGELVE